MNFSVDPRLLVDRAPPKTKMESGRRSASGALSFKKGTGSCDGRSAQKPREGKKPIASANPQKKIRTSDVPVTEKVEILSNLNEKLVASNRFVSRNFRLRCLILCYCGATLSGALSPKVAKCG